MAASITWTDGIGLAVLMNGKPRGRFASWSPRTVDPGPGDHELGSGQRHKFAFGARYCATFGLDQIPSSSLGLVDRLANWLDNGGTVTVVTGDGVNGPYDCCLMQGAELPAPELSDRVFVEYTVQFALMRNDGVQASMLCAY